MKRKSLLTALLALSVLTLASCSQNSQAKPAAKNAGDKFIVGFDANFPPYGYLEDGEYVGFDLDLAAEVAERNDWEIVLQPIDWDSKDAELNSAAIDVIWNGFTINGREDLYTWTEPYVDNSQVFVVRTDSGIESKADLAGRTVLVQADSSALAALEEDNAWESTYGFSAVQQVPDYNTAFMNLESGAADVVAMDVGVAGYQIETRGGDDFRILDEQLSSEQYGVGFKLGQTALRDQVQKTLDEMQADGTFLGIAEEWGLADAVILD